MEHGQSTTGSAVQSFSGSVAVSDMSEPTLISDIMQYGLVTVGPETSGHEAIRLLVEKDISGLPVVDGTRLVGMISEKDILKMVVRSDSVPGSVSEFMTTDVVTCDEDASISEVCTSLAEHSFRHIPAMRGRKLVGIVSRSDLIRAFQGRFKPDGLGSDHLADASRPVARDVMTYGLLTVTSETPVYRAMQMLASREITGLPVVDDAMRLVGILSEKDIIEVLCDPQAASKTVGELMTADVVSFDEDDCLMDICDCLARSDFRRVPILNNGKLIGIVSRRDLIVFLLKNRSFVHGRRG